MCYQFLSPVQAVHIGLLPRKKPYQHDDPLVQLCRGVVWTKISKLCNQLQKNLVSDLILIKRHTRTRSLTIPQSWDTGTSCLRLSLRIQTQKFTVSDGVLRFRLDKWQSRTQSQNWDLENSSLGPGLKTETQKMWVLESVLKLGLWEFENQNLVLLIRTMN